MSESDLDTKHVRPPMSAGRPTFAQFDPGGEEWEAQYANMMATFKDAGVENSEISVYRRGKKESKYKYVDTVGVDGFSIQGIAEEYGGGKYQFKTKLGGQLGPVFCVEIDDRILGMLDKQTTMPVGPNYDPLQMLKTVKDVLGDNPQNSATNDILKSMLENQEKQRANSQNLIVGMITAIAPIVAAIISRPSVQPVSSNDKLFEIILPLVMNKPNTDMAASLEFVKGLKALATDRPEKDSGMLEKIMAMAATALPALAGAVSPQLTRQLNPPMNQIPDQPQPGQPMPPQQPPDISQLVPRVYAAMLTKAAKDDADVGPWVSIIEQMTDDTQWDGLQDLLLRADWLAVISHQLPELAPYPEWLGKLRDALLEDEDLTEPEKSDTVKTS